MGDWSQWIRQSLLPTIAVLLLYEIVKGIFRGLFRSRSETRQREDRFNGSDSSGQLSNSQIDARIDARMNSILDAKIDARIGFLLGSPVPGQTDISGAERRTTFTVVLKDSGKNKINTIKAIREVTGLDLKGSKDLADSVPRPLKEYLSRDEALALARKFEGVATVEIV
jgi:large subunit ribosomal protein L7/L12